MGMGIGRRRGGGSGRAGNVTSAQETELELDLDGYCGWWHRARSPEVDACPKLEAGNHIMSACAFCVRGTGVEERGGERRGAGGPGCKQRHTLAHRAHAVASDLFTALHAPRFTSSVVIS